VPQNILHGDTLYNINRNKYKMVCAALAFAKVTFDILSKVTLANDFGHDFVL
jgi:hypothetical protein